MITYPNKLNIDKYIGITAPSDIANIEIIECSINNVINKGYKVIETENVRKKQGLVSSDGKTRANEFISLWKNSNIGHIISARGGEFLMEMIPYLDKYCNEIKDNNPKWVQGYSDTSLLLYYLTTKYKIATIHSENLGGYSKKNNYNEKNIKDAISLIENLDKKFIFTQDSFSKYELNEFEDINSRINIGYNLTENVKYNYINGEGKTEFCGRMLGGCIDAISIIFGTKYDYTLDFINSCKEGIIWYIDNCELTSMELYRRLWKMKELGYFRNVKGFLIGRTYAIEYDYFTFKEALLNSLGELNVPIITDVDIGHVSPQWIIVNGSMGYFKYENNRGELIQKFI